MRARLIFTETEHTFFQPATEAPVIIDCGANQGAFAREILDTCPRARIHSIEPSPAMHPLLEDIPLVRLHRAAVVAQGGTALLHINSNSEASSVVSALPGHVSVIEVPSITLPEVMDATGTDRIDIVKMDIEGAEIEVIKALPRQYLDRIDQLSIEYHDICFPEQKPDIERVDRLLRKAGFSTVNFTWPRLGDVLYFRRRRLGIGVVDAAILQLKAAYWVYHRSRRRR